MASGRHLLEQNAGLDGLLFFMFFTELGKDSIIKCLEYRWQCCLRRVDTRPTLHFSNEEISSIHFMGIGPYEEVITSGHCSVCF